MIFENGVLSVLTEADRQRIAASDRGEVEGAKRSMTLEQFGQLFVRAQDDSAVGSAVITNVEAWNQSTWVRVAIEATAFTLSQLPFEFWRGTDKVEQHPLLDLLKNPNETLGLSSFELWMQTFAIRELYGECFWLIERGARGEPIAFWTYNPHNVKEVVRNGELLAWDFTFDKQTDRVLTEDVIHFSRFSPASHTPTRPSRGRPAIPGLAVSADVAAARYNLSFFNRGAVPDGVYTSTNPEGLDEKSANAILDRIKSKLRAKGHEPILLSDGLTFTPTHQNARDAEFIGGREMNREEILASFGVPPSVAGIMKDASYATAREQVRGWWEFRMKPPPIPAADAFTSKPLKAGNLTEGFSLDGVEALRRDRGEQIKQALSLWTMGVPYNVAERTLDIGTGAVPGGDQGFLPSGRVPAATDEGDDAPAALNGAQLQQVKDALVDLGTGALAPDAVVGILVLAGVDRKEAEAMVAATVKEAAKAPKPAIDPAAPAPEPKPAAVDPLDPSEEEAEAPEDSDGEPAIDRDLEAMARTISGFSDESVDVDAVLSRILLPGEVFAPSASRIVKVRADDDDLLIRILAAISKTDDALRDLMRPLLEDAFQLGAEQMRELLGIANVFDVENTAAQSFLADKEIKVVGINDRTRAKVRRIVELALRDGLAHGQISEKLRQMYNFSRRRAELIAQTETAQTVNGSRYLTLENEGFEKHDWNDANDSIVRETHKREDGHVVKVGERFPVTLLRYPGDMTGAASEVIACFPADVSVQTAGLKRIYRAPYSGQMVTIKTALGNELTGTPNHPIQTPSGFVALGSLKEGDCIISGGLREDAESVDPGVVNRPTTLGKLFDSLANAGHRQRVGGGNVNFYGDRPDGEVEIVSLHGELRNGDESAVNDPLREDVLSISNLGESVLLRDGSEPLPLNGGGLAENSGVSRGGERSPALGADALHSNNVGFALGSNMNPSGEQSSPDSAASEIEPPLKREFGFSGDVSADEFGVINVDPHATRSVDRVVSINTSDGFSGHVYTLETSSGDYYANGIVVSNCRCISSPVFEDVDEGDRSLVATRTLDARAERISKTLKAWEPIERRMTKKIRRFLWDQRSQVLAAIAKA